jgi:hypothetical protein
MTQSIDRPRQLRRYDETGTTLIETAIACAILCIVMAGLMGMTTLATNTTENQGHLSARTAEYAVDKMEQLLELTYGDAQSNTTVFPSITSGGTGLAVGGSSSTAAPVVGYTDYLDANGNVLCTSLSPCGAVPPAGWYYMRAWQILDCGVAAQCSTTSPNLKEIVVAATIATSVANAMKSVSTVAGYKTNCPSGC